MRRVVRQKSEELARKFIDIQRRQFKRLGVFGDWEHPYLTLDPGYEAEIIRAFGRFVERGLFALQHRGQESAGIVTAKGNGELFHLHKAMGLVGQVFNPKTTSSGSPAPAPSGTCVILPPGRATSSTPSP